MKTLKTIANIILGIGAILILNDNADAIYLNIVGVACLGAILAINNEKVIESK